MKLEKLILIELILVLLTILYRREKSLFLLLYHKLEIFSNLEDRNLNYVFAQKIDCLVNLRFARSPLIPSLAARLAARCPSLAARLKSARKKGRLLEDI